MNDKKVTPGWVQPGTAGEALFKWLVGLGADGLVDTDFECACLLDEVAACENDIASCSPGRKVERCERCGGEIDPDVSLWVMVPLGTERVECPRCQDERLAADND